MMNEEVVNSMGVSSPSTNGPIAMPENPLKTVLKRKPLRDIIGLKNQLKADKSNDR